MTVPLIVLAVLSTVGGFIGVPYALSSFVSDKDINVIEHTLEPAVTKVQTPVGHEASTEALRGLTPPGETESASPIHPTNAHEAHSAEEISAERLLALTSVLIAFAGIGIGWVIFQKQPTLEMPRILENKYYVDEIYDGALIHPIEAVSREGLWKIFDVGVLDGILHSIGEAITELGRFGRYLQAGLLRGYAAIILFGALILIGAFAYFSIQPR